MVMNKKYFYVIEVEVPNGSKGWQNEVNGKMSKAIDTLRVAVEKMGGRVLVRY